MRYSDFIVFADETGSDTPEAIDPAFPVFGLAFCAFEKEHYAREVLPRVSELKFKHFGHDQIILHEYEIRRREPPFRFPPGGAEDESLEDLGRLIDEIEMSIVVALADRRRMPTGLAQWIDLVGLTGEHGLAQLSEVLARPSGSTSSQVVHVVVESRGSQSDRRLREAFRRVNRAIEERGDRPSLKPVFTEKAMNAAGLQIADLVAHPVARHFLNPNQANRAWEVIRGHLVGGHGPDGILVIPAEK